MSAIKRGVKPEKLGEALSEILTNWADEQEKEFVKAIDAAAEACNEKAKQVLYKGHGIKSGNYRNSFTVDSNWKARHHYVARWHVKAPHYRLTHLLEYGHLTRDGTSRTKPVEHVKYGREIAEKVLDEKLKGLWNG